MRTLQGGNAAIYLLMCLSTVGATAGIALVLFPAAERTPSFVLSLVMLCFAEVTLFAFPVYHARASASRSAPAFAFGFGFQTALAFYAAAVVALCLLSGVGTISYSLVDRPASGAGLNLKSVKLVGDESTAGTFDGLQHAELTRDRALPAGMQHSYQLEATVQAASAAALAQTNCAAVLSRTELDGDAGSARSQDCLGSTAAVVRAGDLEIRKTLLVPPTARFNDPGLFDLKYRIEVHNTRWFTSFRTLAVAHTVLFLLLLLTCGFWIMGSSLATRNAAQAKGQRQTLPQIRTQLAALAANVALDRHAVMQPFSVAVKSLNDDVTYATPETLPGTESYNESLTSALERLGAEYDRVRSQLPAAPEGVEDIEKAVQALVDKARAMSNLVRERDAAIRAAR